MLKSVLITGGMGFIGGHLTHALLNNGYSVTTFGRGNLCNPHFDWKRKALQIVTADLSDFDAWQSLTNDYQIIFHKASYYQAPADNDDSQLFKSNIKGTQALIDWICEKRNSIKHIILDSSISVYGEGCYSCSNCGIVRPSLRTVLSINSSFESNCPKCKSKVEPIETREENDLNGNSSYAVSKKVQEEMLLKVSDRLGFKLTILRYATVYGPGQRPTNPYSQIVNAIKTGKTITLYEDGMQKRDFVYVDDIVTANIRALSRISTEPLIINIGTGKETTLLEFVKCAINLARAKYNIPVSPIRITNSLIEGDIRHCKISTTKALEAIGFKAQFGIEYGLKKWINFDR